MRKILFGGAVAACAVFAGVATAGDQIVLDFEEPEVPVDPGIQQVEQGYMGFQWSEIQDGPDLSLMNMDWYRANWDAGFEAVSGNQIGWNRFGTDNFSFSSETPLFIKSGYWTNWIGFGPGHIDIDLFLDGELVDTVGADLVDSEWTFVDFGGVMVDEVVIRNGGDGQWWLMDDLVFNPVPAPGAVALIGLAGLAARRRRRA